MYWQLILEEFGTNIQNIAVVDNIVADTINIFTFTTVDWDEPSTTRALSQANALFPTKTEQTYYGGYPLDLV